jgi:PHD/YefM family antitoxin component YafN of YafNO toxin-antitoxin module
MKALRAKDAKYGFGRLIDLARAVPGVIAKHGPAVVVVLALEEFEQLKAMEAADVTRRQGTDHAGRAIANVTDEGSILWDRSSSKTLS